MRYYSFAISDSMFETDCVVSRKKITPEEAKGLLQPEEGLQPCLNPSHKATIQAMKERFGIEVSVPETAPKVTLNRGDSLVVASIRGLTRLDATRHEYTSAEVASAKFDFALWEVIE